MADVFKSIRRKAFGVGGGSTIQQIDDNELYSHFLQSAEKTLENSIKSLDNHNYPGAKEDGGKAYTTPILGTVNMNPGYKDKMGDNRQYYDVHALLKGYANNPILNAIILTRSNQVSLYTSPVRYSEKGQGFKVRLKDIGSKPTKEQEEEMQKIEKFLLNTGVGKDSTRDTFNEFVRKLVRDTYTYDQVNFEKIRDEKGNLERFVMRDPTTIFFAVGEDGNPPKDGTRYVQVINRQIVVEFKDTEMAFAIRNPRTDIFTGGYGYSELEITLRNFISHKNTEMFNDKFFSNGGTTRGVLLIKTDTNQSQQALDMFKREWKSTLSGMNGSWQIPVVNAEDVKFVNMTPTARDMEFEKWLNYNINVISSVFSIDPAEINFPNKGGGATGSGKGGGLNDGSFSDKNQASQNKGLLPLLRFIEDVVNKHIISEFSDDYHFQFVGGDIAAELQNIEILAKKGSIGVTINEIREELGYEEDIEGGDIPISGVVVQRLGQKMQEEQYKKQDIDNALTRLIENTGHLEGVTAGITFQEYQQGLAGNSESVNGKETFGDVGKDGQIKTQENTSSTPQGGTNRDKK